MVFPPDTDTPGFENENKNKVLHVLSLKIFPLWCYACIIFWLPCENDCPWMSFEGSNYNYLIITYRASLQGQRVTSVRPQEGYPSAPTFLLLFIDVFTRQARLP